MSDSGLHIVLLSVHGLVRGHSLELGRDADTGGQVLYVVELARALARHDGVRRVDLVTRLIDAPGVDDDYAKEEETLGDKARIVRVRCGGDEYLRKESLWDHLDGMVDRLIERYSSSDERPDLVHGHYADAGYVGSRLCAVLRLPLVHTGHSLGRVKQRRLIAHGLDGDEIERKYAMSRRIDAEELTLASAVRVIASTHQEIEEQYGLYDFYQPSAMCVIPPGTDLERFHPPRGSEQDQQIGAAVRRFLKQPDKPMILALSRADARKNVAALVHAYGRDHDLQARANLVLVMGNRDDLTDLDDGARDVLTELLQLIDRYDLYGLVAYPKHHAACDVPVLYRLATLSGGVFVNPALTEPFGLTLIEAAASGLPVVATEDGGPRDIIANCGNGLLVDPLEPAAIGAAIHAIVDDWEGWQRRSSSGLEAARRHYSWEAHAEQYMHMVEEIVDELADDGPAFDKAAQARAEKARRTDRILFTDLNRGLIGDPASLRTLIRRIRANRNCLLFGVSTGLRLDAALRLMKRHGIPEPDCLVTSTGTHITYAPKLVEDVAWTRHIEKQWTPQVVRRVLARTPGLQLRARDRQSDFKVSYLYDPDTAPSLDELSARLFQEDQAVNVLFSHGRFLNVVPIRASKGLALRYVAARFGVPLDRVLAIGGSAADADMLSGNTLAAIVGELAQEELSRLNFEGGMYIAREQCATGILEAIDHYGFLEDPEAKSGTSPKANDGADDGPGDGSGDGATDRERERDAARNARQETLDA